MDNNIDKVYSAETIPDSSFPQVTQLNSAVSTPSTTLSGVTVHTSPTISDQPFPIKRVATELLSEVLNTRSKKILQEFQFTSSGALQIGDYTQGVSGDLRISPNGITARDMLGNTTFNLDGTTGDAVFAGELRSGSTITGQVIVGNNNIIIDGENRQFIINDGTTDRILIGFEKDGF